MVNDFKAEIVSIKDLSKTVRHFILNLGEALKKDGVEQDRENSSNFTFEAGQFLNLSFKIEDNIYRRAYSIASNPNDSNIVELCIKLIDDGKVTPKIWELKVGDFVNIKAPLGVFKLNKSKKEKIVFIGTGTGIAPLRSMIFEEIANQNKILESDSSEGVAYTREILLIYGCRFEEELLYKQEFEYLMRENPNFKFIPVISRPNESWIGRTGHVQENLDMVDIFNSDIFICGLPQMYEGVKSKLIEKGILPENIFHEVFR